MKLVWSRILRSMRTWVEQRRVTPAASTKPLLPRNRHRSPAKRPGLSVAFAGPQSPGSLYRGIEIRRLTRTDAALDRGPKRAIPLGAIDALFVTVNTSSSRTGFSSELTLESLGFCR